MIEAPVTIVNTLGLHARAAARLVNEAGKFDCDVYLVTESEEVNAKSILGVLLLAATPGTELVLRCSGPQEREALAALEDLVESGFGEGS